MVRFSREMGTFLIFWSLNNHEIMAFYRGDVQTYIRYLLTIIRTKHSL